MIFHVSSSLVSADSEHPAADQCTPNDRYNSVLYEHGVVAQVVAVAGPKVLPQFYLQVDITCSPLVPS